MSEDVGTVVRMKRTFSAVRLFEGETYPHEGYLDSTHEGQPLRSPFVQLPNGDIWPVHPDFCEVIEVPAELHQITGHANGPDLDDLVRLIRYLREHDINPEIGWPALASTLTVCWRGSRNSRPDFHWTMTEGRRWDHAACYVGPDGSVYNANGEAL